MARGTVSAAYGQLAAEGYLKARQGVPVRVGWQPRRQPPGAPSRVSTARPRHVLVGYLGRVRGVDADVSVKARTGSTLDPDADRSLPVWAGHVPARLAFCEPVAAVGVPPGIALPPYLRALTDDEPSRP